MASSYIDATSYTPTTSKAGRERQHHPSDIPVALQHSPSPSPVQRSAVLPGLTQRPQDTYAPTTRMTDVSPQPQRTRPPTPTGPSSDGASPNAVAHGRRSSGSTTGRGAAAASSSSGTSATAAAAAAASLAALATSEPSSSKSRGNGAGTEKREDDVKVLAKRLATRLQYAAFKVERGWTKYSLSEVENLYWRATGTMPQAAASGPRPNGQRRVSAGYSKPSSHHQQATALKRSRRSSGIADAGDDGDVFGGSTLPISSNANAVTASARTSSANAPLPVTGASAAQRLQSVIGASGMPTPPPSAGTDLSASSSASVAATKQLDPSAMRVSPTRTIQAVRAGSTPNSNLADATLRRGVAGSPYTTTGTNNVTATGGAPVGASYADFWSKLGSANPAAAAANLTSGSVGGSSPGTQSPVPGILSSGSGNGSGLSRGPHSNQPTAADIFGGSGNGSNARRGGGGGGESVASTTADRAVGLSTKGDAAAAAAAAAVGTYPREGSPIRGKKRGRESEIPAVAST